MKKVLILAHNFPPAMDGGSQLLLRIAKILKRDKEEVVVFTSDCYSTDDYIDPKAPKLKSGWQKEKGFKIFRLKTYRWGRVPLGFLGKKISLFSLFKTGPVFLSLPFSWLRKWRPEVIIAGVFPTTIPFYAWLFKKIIGSKLILLPCFHAEDKDFYRFPLIPILKQADLIYALTKYEKSLYIKKFKIGSKKIVVFKPPISDKLLLGEKESPNFPKKPTLLFMGSQSAHKKIDLLVEAFSELASKPEYEDLRLIIAGKKTLFSPAIEKKIGELDGEVRKKIKTLGKYTEKEKKKLIDKASVLINPSNHESLGLVLLEAWARKKPVIAANLDSLKEVIEDKKSGFLFQKDDLEDLVKKIRQVIDNQKKAKRMGEKGYQNLVKKFALDSTFREMEI